MYRSLEPSDGTFQADRSRNVIDKLPPVLFVELLRVGSGLHLRLTEIGEKCGNGLTKTIFKTAALRSEYGL